MEYSNQPMDTGLNPIITPNLLISYMLEMLALLRMTLDTKLMLICCKQLKNVARSPGCTCKPHLSFEK